MKTKYYILLFAGLLAVCIALSIGLLISREPATHAQVISNGQVLYTLDLSLDRQITVTAPNGGTNVITVRSGAIGVSQASCPDHYCMKRGFCSSGTQIVCLPNALVIRFTSEQDVDALVG